MQLKSTNPALAFDDRFDDYYGAATRPDTATLSGVVNKTGILVSVTCVVGAIGYAIAPSVPFLPFGASIAAFVFLMIVGGVLRRNPKLSPQLGLAFAAIEGLFLGSLTALLDNVLVSVLTSRGVANPQMGLALPAFVITASCLLAMMGLYKAKILRPTKKFAAVVGTLTLGVMITYVVMFVLSMFGVTVPYLSLSSAEGAGMAPWIGIGFSLFVLVLASLGLIMDFGAIEEIIDSGAPKYMEWYGGFILLTTLAWIYFEALKLVFRLAILFSGRD